MNVLGLFAITRAKRVPASPVFDNRGAWFPWIREPYTGAWQRDDEWTTDTVLASHAVYACITLIAQDIGKLRPKLVEQDANGIWTETSSAAFSPVLRRPNTYQNHIQFKEWWITSKLIHGNTYSLKERDNRGVVRRLHLLDPSRVTPMVAPDGSVFYELHQDNLSGLPQQVRVSAAEIIHDRMNCLFHPLVGVSPIFACGLAANMGLKIQRSSSGFFGKGAHPSGVLTAPGKIDQPTADRLAQHWNTQFTGDNAGRVAVLTDGLKWDPMRMTAVDAQLIEQLKMTDSSVCTAFHVPPFKIGIGSPPTYANAAESLNQVYYSDCLQAHIEAFELCMDEGLGIGVGDPKEGTTLGVELDLDGLIRMDTGAQMSALSVGIGAGIIAPNEARQKLDMKPVEGGESPMIQQQNFSLAALAERDRNDPFSKPTPAPDGSPATPADDEEDDEDDAEKQAAANARVFVAFRKALRTRKAA